MKRILVHMASAAVGWLLGIRALPNRPCSHVSQVWYGHVRQTRPIHRRKGMGQQRRIITSTGRTERWWWERRQHANKCGFLLRKHSWSSYLSLRSICSPLLAVQRTGLLLKDNNFNKTDFFYCALQWRLLAELFSRGMGKYGNQWVPEIGFSVAIR